MNATTTEGFCDWRIEVLHCIGSTLWTGEAIFSLVTYGSLALSGLFIFVYRYKYMWQGLFVDHGAGIRPLPVDCLLLFLTITAFLRTFHCSLMLLDVYTAYWQRELGQEIAWTFLSYGAVLYVVGIIYTIPVSYTRGTSGVVSHQTENPGDKTSFNLTTHEIFIPTPSQLNCCLAIWCLWPSLIALPCAILSGIARDHGNVELSSRFTTAQYVADFLFDMSFAVIAAYYGIMFILILRSTMKNFDHRSGFYSTNGNHHPTRKAFHRLKYTMTYLFFMSSFTGPWWLVWGIAHTQIIASINNISIFLSVMWYITGPQGLIAVCQYVLAKRVFLHLTGKTDSTNGVTSITTKTQIVTIGTKSMTKDDGADLEMNFGMDCKPLQKPEIAASRTTTTTNNTTTTKTTKTGTQNNAWENIRVPGIDNVLEKLASEEENSS